MDNLKQQKLKMWRDKLVALEKELDEINMRKGLAAQEGDLRENAAYQMAIEDADLARAKIQDVKKIIDDIEKGKIK